MPLLSYTKLLYICGPVSVFKLFLSLICLFRSRWYTAFITVAFVIWQKRSSCINTCFKNFLVILLLIFPDKLWNQLVEYPLLQFRFHSLPLSNPDGVQLNSQIPCVCLSIPKRGGSPGFFLCHAHFLLSYFSCILFVLL